MPEAIASSTSQVFQPSLGTPRTEKIAEQAKALGARQSEAAAEAVQRQAEFSSNRAEFLSDQAQKLENRAQSRSPENGLGGRLDITL
ncbi:MAG: hypothetical protein RIE06_10280 [Roseibium album]|uniref:Uncharacterized protein n=2 Tax=Roseibium album TaxID=311410 RepID=A0A0M6ZVP1_9HYPH|nr:MULTISPECIES: hypothetical protein [Stappiaceae]MBG6157637.1 hypothetical protein [Labrenzia sp. EL_162]MBG6163070.1 hypothetical protein [Labrenzia sp. EL_195]MBG6174493.1 hypothetical protein [Labrenzia sp. EL_132]MBG6195970.1 hypothetical protein [Labrenzia sp. EL_159]MBG6201392.1 hypothetical protein [Labrenzia sp. EL_13]MBG6229225.1 hypothetical protein [Labrenzia sp. EL_208]MCR9058972.1 hypothetical protein [Paracoccaceae bacterium]